MDNLNTDVFYDDGTDDTPVIGNTETYNTFTGFRIAGEWTWDNYNTIYKPVRSECSSCRVFNSGTEEVIWISDHGVHVFIIQRTMLFEEWTLFKILPTDKLFDNCYGLSYWTADNSAIILCKHLAKSHT